MQKPMEMLPGTKGEGGGEHLVGAGRIEKRFRAGVESQRILTNMQQRRGCQPKLVTLAKLPPRWMELAPLTPTNRASFAADSSIRKRFVRGTNGVQRSGDRGAVECRVPGAIMPYIGNFRHLVEISQHPQTAGNLSPIAACVCEARRLIQHHARSRWGSGRNRSGSLLVADG